MMMVRWNILDYRVRVRMLARKVRMYKARAEYLECLMHKSCKQQGRHWRYHTTTELEQLVRKMRREYNVDK